MGAPVNPRPKRAYHSPRRREQAAATRRAILDAAAALFERQGYPGTTMEEIAGEAGVSLKTVYVAFETKAGLLRALWDLRLKGDQDEAGVAQRPWYREMLEEPDPVRQLRLNARNSRAVKQRIAGILTVIRTGAPADEDIASLWRLIQSDFYENQRTIVESLRAKRALRRGLTVERATDILWSLNHPALWSLLVGQRGWTPAEFERWFASITCDQLLSERHRTGRRAR